MARISTAWRFGALPTNGAIVAAVLLLVGSLWLASSNLNDVRKADALGEQMLNAKILSQVFLSTLTDAETGQRGYLLTGDITYLRPYQAARSRWRADLARLRAEPLMQIESRKLDAIQRLAVAKVAELDETVALAAAGRRQAALNLVRTNRGQQLMDALRVGVEGLNPGGDDELQRARGSALSAWPRFAVVALGGLASSVLIGWGLGQGRERRKVSASLASLERFTSAFGQSQGLLRAMDGEIAFWARGMERLYGYAAEDAVGRQSDDLLQTKFSTPFDTIKASLERDGHWAGDVVKRHKDGSILEIATQWTLHRGELGDADVIIVLDNNISERRRAEQANDRSSMLLRTIVETAPGPIYAKDREGRMLLANGGALQLIGRPWTEVQGRTDRDWLANPAHAEVVMANDRRIMTLGQVEAVEESVEDGHGVVREWLSTKTPIRRDDGEVEGLVGVSVEITELKRRANEMGALNADLNAALADRTAALQQRDMLLREVYHRVKNNLQIIDGFIVLQARQMDDPLAKAALLGLRNRLHALALVHHQLMHSKNLKTFDIAPFLRELADNILQGGSDGVRLSVNAISLEVDLDFAIPLGLLLAELVTNSLKHAFKSGEGMIDVSLERTSDGFIALVVADDGQGRPPPHPSTGARKAGLGTRIIDGLVGQLQGELTMKNDRGAWTEIRVPAPVLS